MDDMHNRIRNEIRDYATNSGMTFFDLRAQKGLLRDIIIRNSNTGEWMVIVQFHYDEEGDEERAKALCNILPTSSRKSVRSCTSTIKNATTPLATRK